VLAQNLNKAALDRSGTAAHKCSLLPNTAKIITHKDLAAPATGAPLFKLANPHPVDPLPDHDLGMLAIASVTAEFSVTALSIGPDHPNAMSG